RHGGDRHARQRVSGADHPHRPAQLAAAQDVRQTRRSTCAYAINGFAMSDETAGQRFATRVIHGGQRPDPLTGAVMPPIYATSTYVQSSPGVHRGFDYSRTRNPTRDALQAALASLEGGAAGFAFASGMAAIARIPRPLEHGFDIVVHSTTKYLNGHSDAIGGAAIVRGGSDLAERIAYLQNAVGSVPSPFDAFLTLRGIKTLALRMERHCANALAIAQ